ncbi:MAG: hypothetical protein WBP11_09720 [Dokdonella sp.]
MKRLTQSIVVIALACALGACASDPTRGKAKALDDALRGYASTVRWGDIEQAESFVDPEYRTAHPLTSIERSRFHQVRVSGYNEQPIQRTGEDEVRQNVEIVLINENTQGVRNVIDRQTWRYDAKANRWWLSSGLPDISPR